MKQHGSVFLLMVRSTFYKVLLLLGAATLAETAVFVAFCLRGPTAKGFGPELLLRQGRIAWIFGAVMVLMTLLLIRTGTEKGAKTGYTLRRLSVSERWVFFWQSAYNTLCYLLLWMWQVLTVMLLCAVYVHLAPAEYVTEQTVFLAFYRSDFLHALLPFEETALWVKNVLLVLSLGIASARYPMALRQGSKQQEISGACCAAIAFFVEEIGSVNGAISILISLITIGVSVYRAMDREAQYEKETA
ncbi:MAG: hypothetical protein IJP11_03925 [Oscillospiraceae bacterium]|nr:hypothetical protein [Oscillospiraceae bacterium]